MKTIKPLLLCIIILAMSVSVYAQNAIPALDSLGFMTGCWEMNIKESGTVISEQWMKPAGGTLIGMSRTIKAGKTVEFEFLRIAENADGVFYIARPSDAKEDTSFKLVKSDKNEAVFENLAHDFPQRIIYRHDKPDTLSARVEAKIDGKVKGIDFPLFRVKCE